MMNKTLYRKYLNLKDDIKENFLFYSLIVIAAVGITGAVIKSNYDNANRIQKAKDELFSMDSIAYKAPKGITYSQIATRTIPKDIRNRINMHDLEDFIQKDLNHRETNLIKEGETIYIPKNQNGN
jgi:hypothetical protein